MAEKPAPKDIKEETAEGQEAEAALTPLDDEESEKKNKRKKLLLMALPVVVVLTLGALYFTGVFDKILGKEPPHAAEQAAAAAVEEQPEAVAYVDLPDLLVNLAAAPGTPQRYLKLKVKLEVTDDKDKAAIEVVLPRVTDGFQTFLREMRVEDLRGSAGMYRLRQELLHRVNIAARPIKVRDVLFQEILLQ